MLQIIADDKIPFLKGVLEPYAQIRYLSGAKTNAQDVENTDALITRTRTKCNASLLAGSKVKMIATATIGFDHIDTAYCESNNITWVNAPGCNSGSVKQYVASVLATLAIEKRLNMNELTIGIVGVGNVGKKVKDVAEAFGMKVLLNDPPRAEKEGSDCFVELSVIQEQADIITFHVPLQREGKNKTFHMGDFGFFSNCTKKPVIINSSRGEVINNAELLQAIDKELLSEVILDVWENEPEINLPLFEKVFIATPHIAGYSVDGKANGTAMSVQAISEKFNLPLKDWYPDNLPLPDEANIQLDAGGIDIQQNLVKAIIHTYNIKEDDKRLRASVETFEEQRGSYPQRREFQAYSVKINNGDSDLVNALNKIGFTNVELV